MKRNKFVQGWVITDWLQMIKVEKLVRTFKTGDIEVKAADNISLTINDSEFLAIVGRSGSGKSTLMNLIGGLDVPDSGTIEVNGCTITSLNSNKLAEYRAKETGFVFQSFHLEPLYTVYDNIRVSLLIAGIPYKEHSQRIRKVLSDVGLESKEMVKVSRLSGGERQRVAIARAIVNDAPIIFADEPCGNLDSTNASMIMSLLRKLNQSGKTVILVTHNNMDARMADRIIELQDGRIIRNEKTSVTSLCY